MNDTVKLLRECDAGVKMGLSAIDEVVTKSKSEDMRKMLTEFRGEHDTLLAKIQNKLSRYHDDCKNPSPVAKGMSWIKTNVKLAIDTSDKTIANLMIDGCDMGIDSLERYQLEFAAADEEAKKFADQLIDLERRIKQAMNGYV